MENSAEIEAFILDFLKKEILGENVQCNADTSWVELGLDSYSTVQLILALEKETGIALLENGLMQIHLKNAKSLAEFTAKV